MQYKPAPPPIASHHQYSKTLLGSARLTGRSTTVDVSNNARFQKLELVSRSGSMRVQRVLITFANGQTQTALINRALSAGKPITIDLEGRRGKRIDKVTVVGRSGDRAAFSVLAV
ncbi:MAG: hypothetical protein KF773_07015 [Deltaproteobacteria bacterium]|nr:hypothetical protein [Deltaproteobacteria bacterium]